MFADGATVFALEETEAATAVAEVEEAAEIMESMQTAESTETLESVENIEQAEIAQSVEDTEIAEIIETTSDNLEVGTGEKDIFLPEETMDKLFIDLDSGSGIEVAAADSTAFSADDIAMIADDIAMIADGEVTLDAAHFPDENFRRALATDWDDWDADGNGGFRRQR